MKDESNRAGFAKVAQFATNPLSGKIGGFADAIEIQLLDGRTSQNTTVDEAIAKRLDFRYCQQLKIPGSAQSAVSSKFPTHTARSRWSVLVSQLCFASDRSLTIECGSYKNTC